MNALEIVLLLIGGIVFLLSFFIPADRKSSGANKELLQEEAKNMVAREVDGMRGRIEDIVDETVGYAMEKTERSLERVSNEKIMAVNEYSDTVLEDIGKNHREVMFLYDMLNDKQKNIKTTVSQVEKTVKQVEQTAREVGRAAEEADAKEQATGMTAAMPPRAVKEDFAALKPRKISPDKAAKGKPLPKESPVVSDNAGPDISFMQEGSKNGNNNERILALHGEGKSNVAIAKELGLGVGEVKLVIDLFEGL